MRVFAPLALATALGISVLWPAAAVAQAAPKVDVDRLDYGLKARALAPGVWVVEGANADFTVSNGCNIINTGFIATGKGVVVINTGVSKRQGEQLRALIARTTAEPVIKVLQLNLHPDYFLGHQGFADVPRLATPATRAGVAITAGARARSAGSGWPGPASPYLPAAGSGYARGSPFPERSSHPRSGHAMPTGFPPECRCC